MAAITPVNGRVAFLALQDPHTYWELNSTNLGTNFGDDTSGNDDNTNVSAGDLSTQQSYEGTNNQNNPQSGGWFDNFIVTDAAALLYLPSGLTTGDTFGLFHNGGSSNSQGAFARATATGVEICIVHSAGSTSNQDNMVFEVPTADLDGWHAIGWQFCSEGGAQGDMGLWHNGVKVADGTRVHQLTLGTANPRLGDSLAPEPDAANGISPYGADVDWASSSNVTGSGILIANFVVDNPNQDNTSPDGNGDTFHTDYATTHGATAAGPPEGTAALALQAAIAATGTRPSEGAAGLAVQVALAATGAAPTIPQSEGTTALGVAVAIAATGTAPTIPPGAGTAALALNIALAATGTAPPVAGAAGTAALSFDVALAATGAAPTISPSEGTAAVGIAIAIAATGNAPAIPPGEGTAGLGIGVGLAATGTAPVVPPSTGTATAGIQISLAAVGFAPGGGGFATLALQIGLAGIGSRPSEGTTALGVTISLAAVGAAPTIPPNTGTADLGTGISIAAAGSAPTVGAASGAAALRIGLALAAVGSRPSQGAAGLAVLVRLQAFSAITGTHPTALASSAEYTVLVMAAPDGQTVMAVSDGDVVRYWQHPGWVEYAGDTAALQPA